MSKDIDECNGGDYHSTCDLNGYCVNTYKSFQCRCKSGFAGNGTYCTNSDECTDGNHKCGSNAYCVDRNGGYVCECDPGYLLDLATNTCYDWDECRDDLIGHECPLHSK